LPEKDVLGASNTDLFEYLQHKLHGSSVSVVQAGGSDVSVESGETISMKIAVNEKKKTLDFTLFSKVLNKPIYVEEINGSTFMDARMEEELEKEDRITLEEDMLLTIDLLRVWAKENHYTVTDDGVEEKVKSPKETKK
jgi:hypothetical protein